MLTSGGDRAIAEVAAKQHGAFTLAQARAAGITRAALRHRVRVNRWMRVCPGVFRLAGAPPTWELRVFAAVAGTAPQAAASHRAAAQLLGIPGFTGNWVEITGRRGVRPPFPQVRMHHHLLAPHHVRRLKGIPTTSVARTLFDLCAVLKQQEAERALDDCLVRKLVTVEAAWRVYEELGGTGRGGSRLFRELLNARGEGYVAPASELERRFINDVIVAFSLPLPKRELDLGDGEGWIGRVEFVYLEARVLVEIDGRLHHTSLRDRRHDRDRDNRFMAAGWRVIRIDYEMLTKRPEYVAKLIREALLAAA